MIPATAPSKEIVTPEGIPVRFQLATPEDRVAAFGIDLSILLLLLAVPVALGGLGGGSPWAGSVAVLGIFLLRTFYFAYFEIRWQGATPGKRRMGIRVVDRRGGPLEARAVLARNLTREFELFLPAVAIAAPEQIGGGAEGWVLGIALLWVFVALLLPLFNREHLRLGDVAAGTVVVRTPRTLLLADLLDGVPGKDRGSGDREAAHRFSDEQLEIYGIYELQVLEDVLRDREGGAESRETRRLVAERIRRKIRYRGAIPDPATFLEDFYAAQRRRLEKDMLLGRRRESKR